MIVARLRVTSYRGSPHSFWTREADAENEDDDRAPTTKMRMTKTTKLTTGATTTKMS